MFIKKIIEKLLNMNDKVHRFEIPKINWKIFNPDSLPSKIIIGDCLVILRYDDGYGWKYTIDIMRPYGSYIDGFWDCQTEWREEGRIIEVVAYCPIRDFENDFDEKIKNWR